MSSPTFLTLTVQSALWNIYGSSLVQRAPISSAANDAETAPSPPLQKNNSNRKKIQRREELSFRRFPDVYNATIFTRFNIRNRKNRRGRGEGSPRK